MSGVPRAVPGDRPLGGDPRHGDAPPRSGRRTAARLRAVCLWLGDRVAGQWPQRGQTDAARNDRHVLAEGLLQLPGPYDLILVEGSGTTSADVEEFQRTAYTRPDHIDTLPTSTAVSAHVDVDFELRGCPIGRGRASK